MRIGLVVDEAGPSLAAVLDQTRTAATAGFDGVWLSQRTSRDAPTTLAITGREAPDIECGTAVVPTCPRHPPALAAQALTVQEAVGGRLVLDVGVSHQAVVEGQYGYGLMQQLNRTVLETSRNEGMTGHPAMRSTTPRQRGSAGNVSNRTRRKAVLTEY